MLQSPAYETAVFTSQLFILISISSAPISFVDKKQCKSFTIIGSNNLNQLWTVKRLLARGGKFQKLSLPPTRPPLHLGGNSAT